MWWGKYATIYVDINGPSGPNTIGKDVFEFDIRDKASSWNDGTPELTGALQGSVDNSYYEQQADELCLNGSGSRCSHWVLKYKNLDYLHCADKMLSEGTHSCW